MLFYLDESSYKVSDSRLFFVEFLRHLAMFILSEFQITLKNLNELFSFEGCSFNLYFTVLIPEDALLVLFLYLKSKLTVSKFKCVKTHSKKI